MKRLPSIILTSLAGLALVAAGATPAVAGTPDAAKKRPVACIVERVTAALDQIDFVVALISRNSVTSPWCHKEVSLAMTGEIALSGVKVLPVRIDQVEMPPSLKDKLYVDVHE